MLVWLGVIAYACSRSCIQLPEAHRGLVIKRHKLLRSILRLPGSDKPAKEYILGQGEKSVKYEFDKQGEMLWPR